MSAVHHFVQMPKESKSGDIGAGVYRVFSSDLRRFAVQCCHGSNHLLHRSFWCLADTVRGAEDAYAQSFSQNQAIARFCAVVFPYFFRIYHTGHGQTVFDITVCDRMTTCKASTRFLYFFSSTL